MTPVLSQKKTGSASKQQDRMHSAGSIILEVSAQRKRVCVGHRGIYLPVKLTNSLLLVVQTAMNPVPNQRGCYICGATVPSLD